MYDIVEIPADHAEAAREWRDQLLETIAENDDEIMELYLEGEEPTEDELHRRRSAARPSPASSTRCCAAPRSRTRASSPARRGRRLPARRRSTSTRSRATRSATTTVVVERQPSEAEPFSALAFKIMSDPHLGKLTYIRVYSGVLETGTAGAQLAPRAARSGSARSTRCTRTSVRRSPSVGAGHIVAVMGLKDTTTGDTLCDPRQPGHPRVDELPGPGHPRGDRAEDQERPGEARHRDPAARRGGPDLPGPHRRGDRPDDHRRHGRAAPRGARRPHAPRVQRRGQRRQAAGRLPRDDHAARSRRSTTPTRSRPVAPASSPRCRSTSSRSATARASGGYEFVNKVTGGRIPREYIPVGRRRLPGGHGVRRPRRLPDGRRQGDPAATAQYHDVDSSELAFKIAGSMAFKEAARKAGPGAARADDGRRGHHARGLHGRRHRRPQQPPRPDPGHGRARRRARRHGAGPAVGDVRLRRRPPQQDPGPGELQHAVRLVRRGSRATWPRRSSRRPGASSPVSRARPDEARAPPAEPRPSGSRRTAYPPLSQGGLQWRRRSSSGPSRTSTSAPSVTSTTARRR